MLIVRDDLIVTLVAVVTGLLTKVFSVDLRLRDGQSENQGRVEVRSNKNGLWGKVCDLNFGDEAAAVVCRQLNFKYSRHDKGVYFPDYPDYQLENFNCNGNETEIEDCIQGEWKTGTGICDVKTNAYAAVCCSNSSDFGEIRDGLFVSHCSDNWADAEERCENKKATLASFSDNKDVLGPVHENMKNRDSAKGYWTKSFFTPWMWSNGCFEFKNDSFDHEEFNLENNTVQACLQMCSIASPPSSFLVSESFCRCIPTESLNSYITEVLPGWCNRKCLGDPSYYCGSGSRLYWSLYTIALESIFYKISDPEIHEHRQCAILVSLRKLSTEDCYKRRGYICGQILQDNSSLPKLLFFQRNRFYEVLMPEARMKCTNDDSTMRLMGEKILEQDIIFSQQFNNLWVDISRHLTDVYTINWEPENRKEISLWQNLEPTWCLATRIRDVYYSSEITNCQTRFRYICLMNDRENQLSQGNGSSNENVTDKGTGYNHTNTITDAHVYVNTTLQVNNERVDNSNNVTFYFATPCLVKIAKVKNNYFSPKNLEISSLLIIVIVAVCAILIVVATTVTLCVYKRSSNKGLWNICCKKEKEYQEGQILQSDYTPTLNASNDDIDHVYDEIKTENIYHEADALIEHRDPDEKRDTNDASCTDKPEENNKNPVTIKRSYSTPKDLADFEEVSEKQDVKNPDYVYPYDKVQRSDNEIQLTDISGPDLQEKGESEIDNRQDNHTVV